MRSVRHQGELERGSTSPGPEEAEGVCSPRALGWPAGWQAPALAEECLGHPLRTRLVWEMDSKHIRRAQPAFPDVGNGPGVWAGCGGVPEPSRPTGAVTEACPAGAWSS